TVVMDAEFNGGDALAVAAPRERSLASRAQIAHPVDRPKRRDQQAISIQLDQRDRVCANLPAFATPHGEQGHGSHLHAHAQQKCGHCVAYAHKCVDTICFCHMTCISFSRVLANLHPILNGLGPRYAKVFSSSSAICSTILPRPWPLRPSSWACCPSL